MVMACYIGFQFAIIERVDRAAKAPDTKLEGGYGQIMPVATSVYYDPTPVILVRGQK